MRKFTLELNAAKNMDKNKNHIKKMAVRKLPKNIDILFYLIDMKRYFKNIDTLTYRCIDITTASCDASLWPHSQQRVSFKLLLKLHLHLASSL